ncbi:MAG: phosphoribosylamine--glycine ligase [Candidatus Moranbacteria bacterium RIFOXYB1_FULL_43_19]|nr:MAG: phosphoribosylamine--glycine ligase [Candidatus Moranbacteria bacterium RIFOXYB1_FULL_43_19]OGI27909.1 MAG: phosphoribosylamine--glycine ligase [Candidatus Moranbacteria bacterium RIFOXYA1_FULL_44_7]OGI32524.1 MAG: phosphoribosylamine--glycine ligase [Candidatus Moranbacteria bacterium RIFOXYC1_FULL_44_13]OGI38145.1 MAG: phosphoribosylamine--glycine ligase [Candidatus Moranbacteria bacterium RIFOXYD1_FULL_44_12]
MKILILDSGGRGDALGWCFKRDPRVKEVFCLPGNAGMEKNGIIVKPDVRAPGEIARFALEKKIDLAVGGSEGILSAGIVDIFGKHKIPIVGPSKVATILEASKGYTDILCSEVGVPVPEFEIFEDPVKAKAYIKSLAHEVVVKCDGLAEGKGAIVCDSQKEASEAVDRVLEMQRIGKWGGKSVVIQKRICGRELSFFCITDGYTLVPLPVAQDYKRAFDGDQGKNTGGMGSYSPHEWEGEKLTKIVTEKIAAPLLKGFRDKRNITYRGFIYFGLIFEDENIEKPVLLEINVRLGDPEAEVIMPRLKTPLLDISRALLENKLGDLKIEFLSDYFCDVVAASGEVKSAGKGKYPGYPGRYKIGFPIRGYFENDFRSLTFSAGITKDAEGKYMTSGGRVAHLVGWGATLENARKMVYAEMEKTSFEGMRFRKDIGNFLK